VLASITGAVDEPLLLRIGGRMPTGRATVMRLDLHDDRHEGIIVRTCQRCGVWLPSASSGARAVGTNLCRFDLLT
jgi:hypothetical protein